ncbi:MAG: ATP-binding protein [Proteobacteria bacterium]|nr:ATP-binding protein [Pseudomonadota bacterium]
MFQRLIKLPEEHSFFLFGARGTGKTTLLRANYPDALKIDLLDHETEAALSLNPHHLAALIGPASSNYVVIDEIQKVPQLLDEVHRLIETRGNEKIFILTGSSARKLKAGGANLLAGRAFLRNLFPLTARELESRFDLPEALRWGTLPKLYSLSSDDLKRDYLESYAHLYLKEEVWGEQIIRNLPPFRKFLEVSAVNAGKIVNTANVARDVGVDPKTVQSYYSILEDTLLGFHIDAYHSSVRKRLRQAPKFYFFDNGVTRALARMLTVEPKAGTNYFGDLFEQFVINELVRWNSYEKRDYRFSYLQSASGVEVDLIIERQARPLALVEIKSTETVREDHLSGLENFQKDFPDAELFLLSRDPNAKKFGRILALPWSRFAEI